MIRYGECPACRRHDYLDESRRCPVCRLSHEQLLSIAERITSTERGERCAVISGVDVCARALTDEEIRTLCS